MSEDIQFVLTPDTITAAERSEIARLIRAYRVAHDRAWGPLLAAEWGGDEPDPNDVMLAGEEMGEATEAIAEWLSDRDVRWPVRCDGRYYLHVGGELIEINPAGLIIDVTGAGGTTP